MHVLIVDDDASIRLIVREVLEEEGFCVLEAADGLQALDVLRIGDRRYLVIVDALMPHLDGVSLLTTVSADKELAARHRFVLMTAATDRLLPPGAFDLISRLAIPIIGKPFDLDEMLDIVAHEVQLLTAVTEH
jgi:DNA-binding NtrC family response regulator